MPPSRILHGLDQIGLDVECIVCKHQMGIGNTACPRRKCHVYVCACCTARLKTPGIGDILEAMQNDRPSPGDKAVKCPVCRAPNPETFTAFPNVIETEMLRCKYGCGYNIQHPVLVKGDHPEFARIRSNLKEHEQSCLKQPGAINPVGQVVQYYAAEVRDLETRYVQSDSTNRDLENEVHELRNQVHKAEKKIAKLKHKNVKLTGDLELANRRCEDIRSCSDKVEHINDRLVAVNKRLCEENKSLCAENPKRARTETSDEASAGAIVL